MQIIENNPEQEFKEDSYYIQFSEMTASERRFLEKMINKFRPKKILELGVAAGSSTVLLLKTIKDEQSHLYSIDYSTLYYRDNTKKSGFVVDNYPELKDKWTLYTGGLASEFMDKIGNDIDFVFLDTQHSLPGELFDFIMIVPYLKRDAVIVMHDVNLHTWEPNCPNSVSNNILSSIISGEKFLPSFFEKKFFHPIIKKDFFMTLPNIAGVLLDGEQKNRIWNVFNVLSLPWQYMPKKEDIALLEKTIEKHYTSYYSDYFKSVVSYQYSCMNLANKKESANRIYKNCYIRFKYLWYSLLAKFTFGKLKERYTAKKQKYYMRK